MQKKIIVKLKQSTKVDLRTQQVSSEAPVNMSPKQLILSVMSQLIEHVEAQIKSSAGEDKKKNQFRLTQFKKAFTSLQSYPGEIISGQQARELPGIGKGIADRIDVILATHTLPELTIHQVMDPMTTLINELTSVTGIGETNARRFIEEGVTSLEDLRLKVASGQIKITHHMQVGLRFQQDFEQKIPYQEVFELGQILKMQVSSLDPQIIVEICGSHRRQRPLSGDIDVLMTHPLIVTDEDLITAPIRYLKEIVKVLKKTGFLVDDLTTQGDTKYMGVCRHPKCPIGHRIDIRFVTYESYFPALVYFTGSMTLNKMMRTIAIEKGYTLNEYGLYRHLGDKEERIIVKSEQEIFDLLGLVYLEPPERQF